MDIPLSADDVAVIVKASAFLNKAYTKQFNTLAALTPDGEMGDPRDSLNEVYMSCEELMEIRRAVQEKPVLKPEHVEVIAAMPLLIGEEFFYLAKRRLDQAVEAQAGGVIDERHICDMRHDVLTRETEAFRALHAMFEMVDKKLAPLANIKQSEGSSVQRQRP